MRLVRRPQRSDIGFVVDDTVIGVVATGGREAIYVRSVRFAPLLVASLKSPLGRCAVRTAAGGRRAVGGRSTRVARKTTWRRALPHSIHYRPGASNNFLSDTNRNRSHGDKISDEDRTSSASVPVVLRAVYDVRVIGNDPTAEFRGRQWNSVRQYRAETLNAVINKSGGRWASRR